MEIQRNPVKIIISDGEEREEFYEAFDEDHALADIARWIGTNRADTEELIRLLQERLNADGAN